jgi:hypothetical protein
MGGWCCDEPLDVVVVAKQFSQSRQVLKVAAECVDGGDYRDQHPWDSACIATATP